ncbi:hypothetical protein FNF31_01424 [Cafeteria roenbergensis]|uniref:Uncharacterized protein n=1 Tax=Cafeteria roenbergensis TaxID=33653 RepID=A0A5A8DLS5_CAFRO|nr:hypothetical protein FNF31_01424 [Cafeteria roenbergensis]
MARSAASFKRQLGAACEAALGGDEDAILSRDLAASGMTGQQLQEFLLELLTSMQAHVEAAEAAADWELGSIPDADAVATTMRDAVDAVAQAQRVFALGKECVWAGTDSEVPLFVPGRVVVRQQTFPIMDQDDEEPNPNYSVWLFSDALMYGAFTADQRYEIVGLISLEPSASPTVDCPKARGKLRNSFRVDHTGGHLSVVAAPPYR